MGPVELMGGSRAVQPAEICPKHMWHGPCGGVDAGGGCEIDTRLPCPYSEVVPWRGAPRRPVQVSPAVERMRALLRTRQVVVADFPARALDAGSIAECGQRLAGTVDAALCGDTPSSRVQFPPSYRAHLVAQTGLAPWLGVNCRDRNRVAIEAELAGLAEAGAAGVHCVTGDHTATGSRPDAQPVFDLDSTQVASLAAAAGHLVSVGESPACRPVGLRPARLVQKERAGAEICFVNHCGGVGPTRSFIAAARAAGSLAGFIPCVPVVLDEGSAAVLRSFPSLVLPPGLLDAILDARDPREAGIRSAVALGLAFLALDGVVGVNLSGTPAPGHELAFADDLAQISRQLRAGGSA